MGRPLDNVLIPKMGSSGYLNPPSQPPYASEFSNGSALYVPGQRINPPYADTREGVIPQECGSGYSPYRALLQNSFFYDNQPHGVDTQSYPTYEHVIPQQDGPHQNSPQRFCPTDTGPLDQLSRFMTSHNVCHNFMLRMCTTRNCGWSHDALFRDTFMGGLFGDAWDKLRCCPLLDIPSGDLPKDIRNSIVEKGLGSIFIGTPDRRGECELRASSTKPSSTLNPTAAIYIPPSAPSAHAGAEGSNETEDEKTEIQAALDSEEVRGKESMAESNSAIRQQGRGRQKLQEVRSRIRVWRKTAWGKTAKTRQRTNNQSDSKAALEPEEV
jgi:hypothetical protein